MAAEFERHGEEEEGQGPSSVVIVSTPPSSPHRILSERKRKDKCFRCGNQGHWAQDCLSTTPTKKPFSPPSTPPPDVHQLPVLRCLCGVTCTVYVSGSNDNYGRRYYARNCNCGRLKTTRLGRSFYRWCDDVEAPLCKCGAGACTINFREVSDGVYIKYYTCRIRTGHGSCGFLLLDSPPPNSWPMEIDKIRSIWSHEDESAIPDSSNRNSVVHEAETSDLVVGKVQHVSRLMSRSDIRSRQIEFQNRIYAAAGNSPNGCKALQILGLNNVHGWVGRLAFPPTRILADPPLQHLFCCMFPLFDLFDPKLVSEYAVPLGASSRKRSFTAMQGLTNPVLKEVDNTFDALSSPLIECEPFNECLMKSIQCISRVKEMELTIQDNCNQQVRNIQQVASHFKEMLHQIRKLETFILNTAKDLGQSMRTMEASYQELTKALKLPQEEVEQCTALDESRRKRLKMEELLQ